ncbi:MAG: hypothetical protein H6744_02550 [Deltaproteobacteria bacterium]|nr:hypothetical protein [Deltaproteobacteria bacterium]MCB9785552.1 hypothetical protein [Deltaproteobacteria bacterium]
MRKSFISAATLLSVLAVSLLSGAAPKRLGADADLTQLSMDELVDSARGMVRQMEEQLATAFKLLEESLAAGDVGATTARNEAITAMKGLVKLSEQNLLTLQQKAAEGDRERAEHEHVKIAIAAAKVAELAARARTAGGIDVDVESAEVDSQVEFNSDLPLIPELSASFVDTPNLVPDPPIHASPYF